jgi:ubiquinone biosynthesis protein UbiJ
MKTPKESRKVLTGKIQQKIQELLTELNIHPSSRIERKTGKAAKKLSKVLAEAVKKAEKKNRSAEKAKAAGITKSPEPGAVSQPAGKKRGKRSLVKAV